MKVEFKLNYEDPNNGARIGQISFNGKIFFR